MMKISEFVLRDTKVKRRENRIKCKHVVGDGVSEKGRDDYQIFCGKRCLCTVYHMYFSATSGVSANNSPFSRSEVKSGQVQTS